MPLSAPIAGPIADTIAEVVRDVLETMFFSTAERMDDAEPDAAAVAASVCFRGDPSGDLRVDLSYDLARAMASAFLGVDTGQLGPEAPQQVACEFSNMICGAILSRVHPEARVSLDPPRAADGEIGPGAARLCFLAPEGPLTVAIELGDKETGVKRQESEQGC
jgi:CheY-specific phosphatase CheX